MGPLYHFISGTQVTQVSATDEESNNILYEIGADGAGKFNINSATGWITSKVVIDREVCIAVCVSKISYCILKGLCHESIKILTMATASKLGDET